MSTQPTALRLADALRDSVETDGEWSQEQVVAAAAELRRLEEENGRLRIIIAEMSTLLLDQRDALLEAAKEAEPMLQAMLDNIRKTLPQYTKMPALDKLRAAIKAVEENT